jgi:hypothetical protein
MRSSIYYLLISMALGSCTTSDNKKADFDPAAVIPKQQKYFSRDPFKTTMVSSQYFEISGNNDTILEGKDGTILLIPKGAFQSDKGTTSSGKITIELAEAYTLDQMLLSNLTTLSNGLPLQSGGMIFLNAKDGNENLQIRKDNPVRIEMPTSVQKAGMMAWEGQRDRNGNMNWINPQALENFLVPVDLASLDFLPAGFEAEVQKGIPFRSHSQASPSLTDSLYFSMSAYSSPLDFESAPANEYNLNEPYVSLSARVEKGKHKKESYNTGPSYGRGEQLSKKTNFRTESSKQSACGIDQARIKVLKNHEFQNTFISTREFENRMRFIHKTCRNDILELYVMNLDKNMWEIDEMAAVSLGKDTLANSFRAFAAEKKTKVREAGPAAEKLKAFYHHRLRETAKELMTMKENQDKSNNEAVQLAEKRADSYRNVLWKREKYRMEKFQFTWTQTGWINIDIGTESKNLFSQQIVVTVDKGETYDNVFTYFIYPSLKSLYRLNTSDNEMFYTGNAVNREIPVPKEQLAIAIVIAYKDGTPYLARKNFLTSMQDFTLFPEPSSREQITLALAQYDEYASENRIGVDLEYQAFFSLQKKRSERLRHESEFLQKLWYKANPCCSERGGKELFFANCAACHKAGQEKLTGPGLMGSTARHTFEWLVKYTRNSNAMIKAGDPEAIKLQNEYQSVMTPFSALSETEIRAIYTYVDSVAGIVK